MARPVSKLPKENKEKKEKRDCYKCGNPTKDEDFYFSYSQIYSYFKRLPVCKNCLLDLFDKYVKEFGNYKQAMYTICERFDDLFDDSAYEVAVKQNEMKNTSICATYFQKINSLQQYTGKTYSESKSFDFKSNDVVYEPLQTVDFKINEEDKKSMDDTKRLLGYDPFNEYEATDQKHLYNELVLYLDEDTLEDPFKIGVVIQIVINNNQIRKANISINSLGRDTNSMVKNSKDISALTDMTTKWNQQNDRLSKENNIALKHRGNSSSKNSTLGSMMKNLRELGFEKAEHDYYDMSKAYGMKISAEISNKSILDVLHFDDNDTNNIFKIQREKLQKLQDEELNYKEEIRRLLCENIEKDKIIGELNSR